MIRVLGTVLAALLGLAFGSFLNVCLSRWPEGESIVTPRSHCRHCGHALAWWENIPLVSWIALRGRCRSCRAWIGWRYVIVEAAVAGLWAAVAWRTTSPSYNMDLPSTDLPFALLSAVCWMAFYWVVVALALLDAEHLWLPNWLTWPGIFLGFLYTNFEADLNERAIHIGIGYFGTLLISTGEIAAAAALILLVRWIYWLIRRREGLGLGDAKLMALLAAWLGFSGAMLSLAVGVVLGSLVALFVLLLPQRESGERWGLVKLPLGAFLCIGGIISALWGQQIIAAYMRWARF